MQRNSRTTFKRRWIEVKLCIFTHYSVLYAEAQLVLGVRPLDDRHGNRGTVDDAQLHDGLVF